MRTNTLKRIDREMSVLGFIKAYTKSNGQPPTVAEIAKRVGVSLATTASYLDHLEQAKLITRTPNVSRGIKIVEPFELAT